MSFHKMVRIHTESAYALLSPKRRPVLEFEHHFDFLVVSALSFVFSILKVVTARARFPAAVKLRTAVHSPLFASAGAFTSDLYCRHT